MLLSIQGPSDVGMILVDVGLDTPFKANSCSPSTSFPPHAWCVFAYASSIPCIHTSQRYGLRRDLRGGVLCTRVAYVAYPRQPPAFHTHIYAGAQGIHGEGCFAGSKGVN
eukprot:7031327-Pyramimonas_sp.AAC.1